MYSTDEIERMKRYITQLAINNSEPEEDVRALMLEAMNAGMSSTDPSVQEQWKSFEYAGEQPTIEEFLIWMVRRVMDSADFGDYDE